MRNFLLTLAIISTGFLTPRASAEFMVGFAGNQYFTFDSATPGTIFQVGLVTGLASGQTVVGADYRPFDGTLVGVGYDSSSGIGNIYAINALTGVASQINASNIPYGGGVTQFGVDFNPTAGPFNALRLISNGPAPNNFRSPSGGTGAVITDTALNSGTGAPSTNVVATAYSNNLTLPGGQTTMYVVADAGSGVFELSTQGSINFPPGQSPNTGTINFIANITGLAVGDVVNGLDISGSTGTAYLSTQNGLYSLNLTSGVATSLGTFGGGFAGLATGIASGGPNANFSSTPAPPAFVALALGGFVVSRVLRRRKA